MFLVQFIYIFICVSHRLREERGDPDRPIPLDQKVRDLSPRNGKLFNTFNIYFNIIVSYMTFVGKYYKIDINFLSVSNFFKK